jgi:hypothetical protein
VVAGGRPGDPLPGAARSSERLARRGGGRAGWSTRVGGAPVVGAEGFLRTQRRRACFPNTATFAEATARALVAGEAPPPFRRPTRSRTRRHPMGRLRSRVNRGRRRTRCCSTCVTWVSPSQRPVMRETARLAVTAGGKTTDCRFSPGGRLLHQRRHHPDQYLSGR